MANGDIADHVFIFANPLSGNQQAKALTDELDLQCWRLKSRPYVIVEICNILDHFERDATVERLKATLLESCQKIHVYSAGGDGNFRSVLDLLLKNDVDIQHPRLLFSTIPLGTGNDMAQCLGFGRTVKKPDIVGNRLGHLHDLIFQRLDACTARFDIWTVVLHQGEIRRWRQGREETLKGPLDLTMTNYVSFGTQGEVGWWFEKHRFGHRVGNIFVYFLSSLRHVLKGTPIVTKKIGKIESGGQVLSFSKHDGTPWFPSSAIEVVIQNIASIWGRGPRADLWGEATKDKVVENVNGFTDSANWTPQSCNDGKLEVFCLRNVGQYFKKQLSQTGPLSRLAQIPLNFTIKFKQQCGTVPCCIDGEFYMLEDPTTITFSKKATIKVAVPHDSRVKHDEDETRGRPNDQ